VIGSAEFDASKYQMEVPVDLESNNAISVDLVEGKRNSYLTVKIVQSLGPPSAEVSAVPETIYRGA
jgi:hypothetical protein